MCIWGPEIWGRFWSISRTPIIRSFPGPRVTELRKKLNRGSNLNRAGMARTPPSGLYRFFCWTLRSLLSHRSPSSVSTNHVQSRSHIPHRPSRISDRAHSYSAPSRHSNRLRLPPLLWTNIRRVAQTKQAPVHLERTALGSPFFCSGYPRWHPTFRWWRRHLHCTDHFHRDWKDLTFTAFPLCKWSAVHPSYSRGRRGLHIVSESVVPWH